MKKYKTLYVVPSTNTTNRVFRCCMYQVNGDDMDYLGYYQSKAIGMSRVFDCVLKCCRDNHFDFHKDNIKYKLLGF